MAFGFTPKFEQNFDLNGLSKQHYLVIAFEAAQKLGWDVTYLSAAGFTAYIGGGMFTTAEEFKLVIKEEIAHIISKTLSSGMMDWGKNKNHINEFTSEFAIVQTSMNDEELDAKYLTLAESFPPVDDDELLKPPPTAKQNLEGFMSFFIPRQGFSITPIIIDINIAIFILMIATGVNFIEPSTEDLLKWGANFRASTLGGEWWRLLANTFLHIGILHLLMNMYALVYIGLLLEPFLGKARFIVAYLITGILASVTSIYWHPVTVSAGASGAIFGMYGVFLAMLTTNVVDKSVRKALLTSIGVFVVFNLMNGAKAGIDNAAHIGGLVSGLVIGYAYYFSLKRPFDLKIRYITITFLTVAASFTAFTVCKNISNDIGIYQAKMETFQHKEEDALKVFKVQTNDKATILAAIQTGIADWQANLQLIKDANKLDIPDELKSRNNKLLQYCQLRINSYQLIYKQVNGQTTQYKAEIDSDNKQIEGIINDLKGK